MKKRGFLLILFIASIIIFSIVNLSYVNSIGISPSRIEIPFEPDKEIDCSYYLKNNAYETNLKAFVYPSGDLNASIEIEENNPVLIPNLWTPFSCKMKLPSTLSPGLHDNGVVAAETEPSGGSVGAIAGVKMQLWVRVPYPGRYLEGTIEVNNIEINQKANFKINLISRGNLDITNTNVYVDVYDVNNNKVATVESDTFNINANAAKNIEVEWDSSGNKAGIYNVVARVYYDDNYIELRNKFRIGDLYIEITNVTVENIKRNNIGKFSIRLMSMWNAPIENVYAQFEIIKDNNVVNKINSESVIIQPWSDAGLYSYWDSKDAVAGDYKARAVIHYEGKTNEKTVDFKVIELTLFDKIKGNIVYLIIILVLLLAVLINIIITWRSRKKRDEKEKK